MPLSPEESATRHNAFESNSILYIVTAVSNPKRYASRYRLWEEFREYIVKFPNVRLMTVELAFGERDFCLSPHGQHEGQVRLAGDRELYLQYRTSHELWHKENLLNLGIAHLPADWKYVAWVDADVTFARSDWATETLHLLQHYAVVQMFSHAEDLGPNHEPIQRHTGFMHRRFREAQQNGHFVGSSLANTYCGDDSVEQRRVTEGGYAGHPGYAWAFRRAEFEAIGGLIDTAICGAGDHHMALGFFGDARRSLPVGLEIDAPYAQPIMAWQDRAVSVVKGNVGVMPGLLLHYWHGKKADRLYQPRWAILQNNDFDPRRDIVRDSRGVWQLAPSAIGLRDDLRRYFAARSEDSIDL